MVRPKTLFEMFGHDCDLKTSIAVNLADKSIINNVRREEKTSKISNYFKKLRMINETNKAGYNFLRSYKKIENEYRKQMEYSYVIHPFSNIRKFWETWMILNLTLQFYMIPLDIGTFNYKIFQYHFVRSKIFYSIRLLSDIVSFVDIGIQFFSGYLDNKNNTVVLKPLKIFKHYIFPQFIIDLVCSLPGDVVLFIYHDYITKNYSIGQTFLLHLLGFVKLIRYITFVKYAKNISAGSCSYYTYKIIVAFITLITYIHVVCCFILAWNSWENPMVLSELTGLRFRRSYGQRPKSFFSFYLRFFYGSCFLVLNSGYGFHNNSNYSIFITVIIWMVSRIAYIGAIAYFMQLHIAAHSSQQKYIDLVSEVKDYMEHRQIPTYLRKRIVAYFDIKFQNKYFRESDILMTVSGQLKQEIIMHKTKTMIQRVPFFLNIPISLLVRIISSLEYEIFLTNDVILKYGSVSHCMFFIASGTVAIFSKSGREVAHLQDDDYFGEAGLVIDNHIQINSFIAAEVCELYRLDKKKFIKAIMPYPDLFDKIKKVAHKNLLENSIPIESFKK